MHVDTNKMNYIQLAIVSQTSNHPQIVTCVTRLATTYPCVGLRAVRLTTNPKMLVVGTNNNKPNDLIKRRHTHIYSYACVHSMRCCGVPHSL